MPRRCSEQRGVVLVSDETLLPFASGPSAARLCADYPNLTVMKAFTKFHSLAGLRLGYSVCSFKKDERLVQELEEVLP